MYTAQKQLGKDAQLAAAEIVRRAERGIGVAIRRGQQNGRSPSGGIAAAAARPAFTAETRVIGVATIWVRPARSSGTVTSAPTPTR